MESGLEEEDSEDGGRIRETVACVRLWSDDPGGVKDLEALGRIMVRMMGCAFMTSGWCLRKSSYRRVDAMESRK